MATLLSILLMALGIFLALLNPAVGCLTLIVSALVFISGNRMKRQREERQRHEELLEATRQGKRE